MKKQKEFKKETELFKKNGGMLQTSKAIYMGIHPRTLYAMREKGVVEPMERGLYRLSEAEQLSQPDLTTVALKIPQGVLCLISALSFHNITTQIPHAVDIALKSGARKPRIKYPPCQFVWLSEPAFSSGIETHRVDGVPIKVYSLEKTVADCFKFRNKVGLDVAIEALKDCREKKGFTADPLLKYARICRVEKIMTPYLQAIL
ncbi:MAG: type IV toxin-antitoxin system AbiEi family antitoxin domain-containing protein [Elusimicrobia bacterium]|nr:type IV toxin-antitoxin system AbiEi family antitoxin domain-containing protein [Candidatus Obscuribacterium magneticum]MCB4755462.1 type IV toxin-antitoxin system AbiEi family antitoxin domain-containing protein [Candidatus Obscuribacterium magneticum]